MHKTSAVAVFSMLLALPALAQEPAAPQDPPRSEQPAAPAQAAQPEQPKPRAVNAELAVAEDKLAAGDLTEAQGLIEKYLATHAVDSDHARALFDLGYISEAQYKNDAAQTYYQRAIQAEPQQFEAHLALGLLLARQGKQPEAVAEIETATKLQPATPNPEAQARAWRALAQLKRSSDPSQARYALLEALKITPETQADVLLTAQIAEAADDLDTAEAAYRRALRLDPKSAEATAGLAHLMVRKKAFPEAEQLLQSALNQQPGERSLRLELAVVQQQEGKTAEAVETLELLHKDVPDDVTVSRMLADSLLEQNQPDKADEVYQQLLAASPKDSELLLAHGQCLIRMQRYPDAVTAFEQATKLDSSNGDAWSGLAFAANASNQSDIAIQALTMRAKYLPDTAATYFLWATSYDRLHQTKEAAGFYQKFLASAGGKFPDQEWQAKQRLVILQKSR